MTSVASQQSWQELQRQQARIDLTTLRIHRHGFELQTHAVCSSKAGLMSLHRESQRACPFSTFGADLMSVAVL